MVLDLLDRFGWVLAGGVVGLVAWLFRRRYLGAAERLIHQVGILGRALAPLVLPILVVGAFAATYYGWVAQVVLGAVIAALLWLLFKADSKLSKDRFREAVALLRLVTGKPVPAPPAAGPEEPKPAPAAAAAEPAPQPSSRELTWAKAALAATVGIVIVVLVVFTVVFSGGWSEWKDAAGWSGVLTWAAVQLLVAAFALRLCGYAITPVRVAVAVTVAVIAAAATTQVLWNALGKGRPWFLVGLVIVLALLGWEAFRLRDTTEKELPQPSTGHRVFRVGGFWLAAVAAAGFLVGMVSAWDQTTNGTNRVAGVRVAGNVPLVQLGGDPATAHDRALAWTFTPMLRLTDDEKYPPTNADAYARKARCDSTKQDPFTCRNLRCKECEDTAVPLAPGEPKTVFYARVVTKKSDPSTLAAWTPDSQKRPLKTLIQYWIFYDYDLWDATTVLGRLVQKHDADWEFVAVGLDDDDQPIFLALSAHCGGQVVPWDSSLAVLPGSVEGDKVRVLTPEEARGVGTVATHPLVAVARGSHGNYADDGSKRPPDWGSCTRINSKSLGPIVYASNVRDVTASNSDDRHLAQADDIQLVNASTFPMNVYGPWGRENISFGFRDLPEGSGPRSPPAQSSWGNALRLFFCNPYWKSYEKPPARAC